jgi:hypothetical protein
MKRLCEAMDHARGQNRMYRALLDRIQSEADAFRMALYATTIRDERDRSARPDLDDRGGFLVRSTQGSQDRLERDK